MTAINHVLRVDLVDLSQFSPEMDEAWLKLALLVRSWMALIDWCVDYECALLCPSQHHP